VTGDDPGYWNIDLPGGTTTWAIITAITNVNDQKPIVSASSASCDRVSDSVFTSAYGKENDVLLLSQSFDDTASMSDFKPPDGTSLLGWARSEDEVSLFVANAPFAKMKHSTDNLIISTYPRPVSSSEKGSIIQDRPGGSSLEAPEDRPVRMRCCQLL
jgi:hypothetical protein